MFPSTLHRTLVAVLLATLVAFSAPVARATPLEATAQDSGASGYYTFGTAVEADVESGGTYAGIASVVTALEPPREDFLSTTATIRAGTNSGEDTTVTMAWRNRTEAFETDAFGIFPYYDGHRRQFVHQGVSTPPRLGVALAWDAYTMVSDILNLGGIAAGDVYVLEMTYDEASIFYEYPWYDEQLLDDLHRIYLGWFETDDSVGTATGYDEWVNAVDGNSTTGGSAVPHYKGTWDEFLVEYPGADTNLGAYLGSWGTDISDDVVWAVLDHTSPFGVVPEPSTLLLLAAGGLALVRRARPPA